MKLLLIITLYILDKGYTNLFFICKDLFHGAKVLVLSNSYQFNQTEAYKGEIVCPLFVSLRIGSHNGTVRTGNTTQVHVAVKYTLKLVVVHYFTLNFSCNFKTYPQKTQIGFVWSSIHKIFLKVYEMYSGLQKTAYYVIIYHVTRSAFASKDTLEKNPVSKYTRCWLYK